MTEETQESSTSSHLSVVMITPGIRQVSYETTPSPSLGITFYFRLTLLLIGLVGTATNGLVLYALVASEQHKKHVLIVNQNALDFFTSSTMAVVYSVKLSNIYLTGSLGHWLCTLILSDGLIWWGITGSVINLAGITVERYLKVVHYSWSKIKLKNWMIYSAMAFSWIGSFAWLMAVTFPAHVVIDGSYVTYVTWENNAARIVHGVWYFVSFYLIILLIFTFCYWRILVVIRRQANVMAGHAGTGPNTSQAQSHKIQSNVVKTMIFVCALYAITWLPIHVYSVYADLNQHYQIVPKIYYGTSMFAFLYMCTNPFVYATKFDPVSKVLLLLIPCKKNSE